MPKDIRNYIFFIIFSALQFAYYYYSKNVDQIAYIFSASTSIVLITTYLIVRKNKSLLDTLSFSIYPIFSILSLYMSSTIIERSLVPWLGISVNLLLSYYLKQIYIYHKQTKDYRIGTLENFSNYGNLILFFLIAFAMHGFKIELDSSTWLDVAITSLTALFLIYQLLWSSKLSTKEIIPTLLISTLSLAEISWGISLLPFDYLSSAILLTIAYYSLSNIAKHFLLKRLDSTRLKFYFLFLTFSYILIFLTVRWL